MNNYLIFKNKIEINDILILMIQILIAFGSIIALIYTMKIRLINENINSR